MSVRRGFITFNTFLHTKSVPKLIDNRFSTPITFENQIKGLLKITCIENIILYIFFYHDIKNISLKL